MKLSTRARYALRLMIDLADHARPGSPTALREVARRQQISKRYLEQLATVLKHANLVVAAIGRGGGYSLPRRPEEIKVSEIVRATIGEINIVDCVAHKQLCDRAELCPSRDLWVELNRRIWDTLDGFTLADLSEKQVAGLTTETTLSSLCAR